MKPTLRFQIATCPHTSMIFFWQRLFSAQLVHSCVYCRGVKYKRITCRVTILQTSKLGDTQGKIRKPRLLDTFKLNHEEICFVGPVNYFSLHYLLIAFHFIALFIAFQFLKSEDHLELLQHPRWSALW